MKALIPNAPISKWRRTGVHGTVPGRDEYLDLRQQRPLPPSDRSFFARDPH